MPYRLCLSWLLCLVLPCLVGAKEPDRPLNLVVVMTDEHHFGTLGCYGGQIVQTPHIDSLATDGALCTSFYATTPVCSPSRASFVSGLYPQHTPVVTNNIPLDDSVVTFAEILRQQGYATGYAGKWHLNGSGKPEWAPQRKFGFEDNRFMFNRGHWKKFEDTPAGPRVAARNAQGKPSYAVDQADERSFSTDWLINKAMEFVHENQQQPFCYFVSLPDPHGPNTVRAPYDTMYRDIEVPLPATLQRSADQIPAWGKPQGVTAAALRRNMPPYYGMVKCIDDNIGRLIQALQDAGVWDHTILVLTSDHGDLCGEHGRLNKGVPYEGSARIPFLIRCPGKIAGGTTIKQALSSVDFLPTILPLMDVPLNHTVDGRNASALFQGPTSDWDDVAFLRSTQSGKNLANVWLAAVTAQYKLVLSAADEPWLIDLVQDPNELTNLFGHDQHQATVKDLAGRLAQYCQQTHDEYARVPRIKAAFDAAR